MGRRIWIIANAIIIYLGYRGIRATDFDHPDPFYSITLPLLDMAFLAWLLILVGLESYRKTWQ